MDRRQPPLGSVGRRIGRAALRVTAIGGLLCAFFVVGATDSRAEISNDGLTCHATIAGVSIDSQDSENAGSAIEVSKDATVTVHEDASSMIQTYTVDLAFALRGWQVASGGSTTSSWDS